MEADKKCFVICPIGDENSSIRKRSDNIFEFIIKPIVSEFKYKEPLRSDKIGKPGLITNQILQLLFDVDLVIADLSGHNPNVFYELAIRHAARKPVIQIIEKDEKVPFDIAGLRTIYINTKEFDLANIERVKTELTEQIRSIEGGYESDNPVLDALKVKFLKESTDTDKIQLADLLQELVNLKDEILFIKNNLTMMRPSGLNVLSGLSSARTASPYGTVPPEMRATEIMKKWSEDETI